MQPALQAAQVPVQTAMIDKRVVWICALSVPLAAVAALTAQGLTRLIR